MTLHAKATYKLAIRGTDLLPRLAGYGDLIWRMCLNWECKALDSMVLKCLSDLNNKGLWAIMAAMNSVEQGKAAKFWWLVSWPEGTTDPRIGPEATFEKCIRESDARAEATDVFGD